MTYIVPQTQQLRTHGGNCECVGSYVEREQRVHVLGSKWTD